MAPRMRSLLILGLFLMGYSVEEQNTSDAAPVCRAGDIQCWERLTHLLRGGHVVHGRTIWETCKYPGILPPECNL